MTTILPNDFTVRAPHWEDLENVAAIIIACDIVEQSAPDYAVEDVRGDWQRPGFNLEKDAWVVSTSTGRLVAYANILDWTGGNVQSFANVHPDYTEQGIGRYLLTLIEARVRLYIEETAPQTSINLRNWISRSNKAAHQLLAQADYKSIRHFWTMRIELKEAPPAPQLPENMVIRTFERGQDEWATYEAYEESFQDHWGHIKHSFEEWKARRLARPEIDTSLWFLATEGDEIGGYALCSTQTDYGWVDTLGTRRNWRKRGLGMALLRHAFNEFYQRGKREIKLRVDAQNPTGATRLYERAGMNVVAQFELYEKVMC